MKGAIVFSVIPYAKAIEERVSMKAVVIARPGGPEVLEIREVEMP